MGPHACGSKYKREAEPKPSSGKGDEEKENLIKCPMAFLCEQQHRDREHDEEGGKHEL